MLRYVFYQKRFYVIRAKKYLKTVKCLYSLILFDYIIDMIFRNFNIIFLDTLSLPLYKIIRFSLMFLNKYAINLLFVSIFFLLTIFFELFRGIFFYKKILIYIHNQREYIILSKYYTSSLSLSLFIFLSLY